MTGYMGRIGIYEMMLMTTAAAAAHHGETDLR